MNIELLNEEMIECHKCPRLVEWREKVSREKRRAYKDLDYWGKPVPGFGDPKAGVFVVGLAPGAHGSNRTGRQFTGDASGDFFYPALYRAGFGSQPISIGRGDGLTLAGLYTAPVCRCAPPDNKPTRDEMITCQPYLEQELELINPSVIVVLGRIAFESILRIYSIKSSSLKFAHGAVFEIPQNETGSRQKKKLICSYHPSQQNTLTGRLTIEMFDTIWQKARELLQENTP